MLLNVVLLMHFVVMVLFINLVTPTETTTSKQLDTVSLHAHLPRLAF